DWPLEGAVAVAEAHADIGLAAERHKLVREAKVRALGGDGSLEGGDVIPAVMVEIAHGQLNASAAGSHGGQKAGHGPVFQGFEGRPAGLRPPGYRRQVCPPPAE